MISLQKAGVRSFVTATLVALMAIHAHAQSTPGDVKDGNSSPPTAQQNTTIGPANRNDVDQPKSEKTESAAPTKSPAAVKLKALIVGLAKSMDKSGQNLQPAGERLSATRALDDARRLARLLQHIVPPDHRALAKQAIQTVSEARYSVQNGAPEKAARILKEGSDRLKHAAEAISLSGNAQVGAELSKSDLGKGVMNVEGSELGVLDRFVTKEDGKDYAVLKVHGAVNLFGLFDIANTLVTVPKDKLVAGHEWVAVASDVTASQLALSAQYNPDALK